MRVDRTIQTFDCVSTKHFVTPMNIPNCYQYSFSNSFKVALQYHSTSSLKAISILGQFQSHLHERKAFSIPKCLKTTISPLIIWAKNYDY